MMCKENLPGNKQLVDSLEVAFPAEILQEISGGTPETFLTSTPPL
jgi:hypothetical protein